MRKTVITLLVLLVTLAVTPAPASAAGVDYGKRVTLLMKEYSGHSDFHLINFGRIGLSLVKTAIRQSGDKDAHDLLTVMRNVKMVSIASYEDCPKAVKEDFESRLRTVADFVNARAK